jgi:hypothetical protein
MPLKMIFSRTLKKYHKQSATKNILSHSGDPFSGPRVDNNPRVSVLTEATRSSSTLAGSMLELYGLVRLAMGLTVLPAGDRRNAA